MSKRTRSKYAESYKIELRIDFVSCYMQAVILHWQNKLGGFMSIRENGENMNRLANMAANFVIETQDFLNCNDDEYLYCYIEPARKILLSIIKRDYSLLLTPTRTLKMRAPVNLSEYAHNVTKGEATIDIGLSNAIIIWIDLWNPTFAYPDYTTINPDEYDELSMSHFETQVNLMSVMNDCSEKDLKQFNYVRAIFRNDY